MTTPPFETNVRVETHPTIRRLTRGEMAVLGLFVAGLVLYGWAPIWLIPPHYDLTAAIYIVILLAWLPASLFLKRTRNLFMIIIIGLFLSGCCGVSLAIRSPAYNYMIFSSVDCTELGDEGDGVHYRCTSSSIEGKTDFDFRSKEGWPFMWRD